MPYNIAFRKGKEIDVRCRHVFRVSLVRTIYYGHPTFELYENPKNIWYNFLIWRNIGVFYG